MDTNALLWIIIVAISGVASNVATVIVAFRRRPPLEGQFADRLENERAHELLHRRIGDLRDKFEREYVSREMFEAAEHHREADREEIKEKLDELLQRTAHLVGYGAKN